MNRRIGWTLVFALALSTVAAAESAPPAPDPLSFWGEWSKTKEPLHIPEQQMDRTLGYVAELLNAKAPGKIYFVDVGCAVGDYLRRLKPLVRKELVSIGVDPLDWPGREPYSYFDQVAITDKEEGEADFYLYGDSDLASSSLEKLKQENVSHDPAQKEQKFYHPATIEKEKGQIRVKTLHLSSVIERHELQNQTIHFLKIDVQGTDTPAFLSLGPYIKNVLFVQIESIHSENKGQLLYEGQKLYSEEKPLIEAKGFRVFNIAAFPAGPEADVTFVNERLLDELLKAAP